MRMVELEQTKLPRRIMKAVGCTPRRILKVNERTIICHAHAITLVLLRLAPARVKVAMGAGSVPTGTVGACRRCQNDTHETCTYT